MDITAMNPICSIHILLLALLAMPCASCAQSSALVVDPGWPKRPEGVAWGAVTGIALDAEDHICIVNRIQPAVQVYDAEGKFVRSWNLEAPDAKGAHGIRIDHQGNFWLTDFRRHLVQKYDPNGKLLITLGEAGRRGNDTGHFDGPTDVAIFPNGQIFVSDGYGNRRVIAFDASGKYIRHWGAEGEGPGQFALPHAIVADSRQRLIVADRNNGRIQVFDAAGKLLAIWADQVMPWGLAITAADETWVCGSSKVRQAKGEGWMVAPPPDQLLLKLDRDGKEMARMPLKVMGSPPQPGEVDWVHGIAVDQHGALYLSDIQGKRVQKFQAPAAIPPPLPR